MNRAISKREVISAGLKSRDFYKLYILGILFVYCVLFYYFGELIDFFGWDALRWEFFYSVHDIHRLLFLAPIIYAGYFFGIRAAIIITIIAVGTFLPRALFVSPFPDPLLRTVLFIVIAGAVGYLTGRESERRKRLEALVRSQSNTMLEILDRMEDKVFITGPDYRIRFMNPSMTRGFGEGVGTYCYEYLHRADAPCRQICKLPDVISGTAKRWEYNFPDGSTYEAVASPYVDSDGTVCQLATLRNINQRTKEVRA